MKTWLRRVRGAIGTGVTWALVWAPTAVLLGTTIIDPDDSMDEMWVMVGALPGFVGGVVFSIVLGIAARRRRLDELSVPRVSAWGALAGVVVGSLPYVLGTPTSAIPLWLFALAITGSITVLSALSAAGTLAVAQWADRRELLHASAELDEVGLTEREARELLAGGDTIQGRSPALRSTSSTKAALPSV